MEKFMMHKIQSLFLVAILGSLSACASFQPSERRTIDGPFVLVEDRTGAPFGGAVSANIVNYTRAAPYVGTAGKLNGDGVAEAKALGFKLIIDLRRPDEDGVEQEQAAVQSVGIAYQNIPLAPDASAWEQVSAVEAALADSANYPVLLHCGSANRAGAVWALYRHRQGVDALTAIEEGRAVGLTSREEMVRDLLGFARR